VPAGARSGWLGWLSACDVSGPQGLGTPTVLVNGEVADLGDRDWLDDALNAGGG
jgi:hypothetical protein